MSLQPLRFKPGINRETTSYGVEGTYYACDKVRFQNGFPQKIGGWVKDAGLAAAVLQPSAGSYWGVARSINNWRNLNGDDLLGVGTNLKYYIQNRVGGVFNDVTPLRETTAAGAVTFGATNGSSVVTVTDTAHGTQAGDFVTFSGAVSLGGVVTAAVLNREYRVASYVSSTQYTINVGVNANASDVGTGGASTVGAYQLSAGAETFSYSAGWGAGGWGGITAGSSNTGWGQAPASSGLGVQLRLWSAAAYGQDLIMNPRGGGLYYWKNNVTPSIFDRAVLLASTSPSPFTTDVNCPSVCNYVIVSDTSRFVIAFGVNDYGSAVQDPLLVSWSEQEDYSVWTPAITNQAGNFRLSRGSTIIAAQQTRQEVLVFTDTAVYSMQYQGPPYVWGFQLLADSVSIAGPNAIVTVQDSTYWMGQENFYLYNGRVQQMPCTLRKHVFDNININQRFQFHAGVNDEFSEVWWFYCTADSDVINAYVVYDYGEDLWTYGTMARTAYTDCPLRSGTVGAGYNGQILYHEQGNDDGSTNPVSPIVSYVSSADFDIGDGDRMAFVRRLIPDVDFDGSNTTAPAVLVELQPRRNPGAAYSASETPFVYSLNNYSLDSTYEVQQFTEEVFFRARGRQMQFSIGSSGVGTMWRSGVHRIDIRQDGRK
jgi:hypothetical protein